MSYTRFNWAANRISKEDMASLYLLKQTTGKPITILVAEAVREYLLKKRINKFDAVINTALNRKPGSTRLKIIRSKKSNN